jgi:hypothetical protein
MENLFCAIIALTIIYSLCWFLQYLVYDEYRTKINGSRFYSVLFRIAIFVSPLAIMFLFLGFLLSFLTKMFLMFLRWFFGCKK